MPSRLRPLLLGLIASAALALPALAGQILEFDRAAFAKAQQSGQRVMLIVSSRWQPASQAQKPLVESISRDFLYPDVQFFRIDYERMKDVLRDFRVTDDATVIVFRGTQERGRLTGEMNELELRHLLDLAR